MRQIFWHFLFLSLNLGFGALALADCTPIGPPVYVKDFTNYTPSAGGMNGHCGTSASGLDTCKFLLEDHIVGLVGGVMAAVPQEGGTSFLYGGIYRGQALESSLGVKECLRIIAGDHYGGKSNGKSKTDIATRRAQSVTTAAVNRAEGQLIPIGRLDLPKPARKIARKPAALKRRKR